ncbi:hypothetical protein V5O48_005599 [Marasmius crinis-equi]|uniref:Autophagy-related protein 14 n=1 Tax=Marasmius crinis-equi TaxID=585013 RepID=A0ABR3FLW0_9AGAR
MTDHDQQHQQRLVERRIRHVTSIQVCNLTPFPLRDAFASALSKPTEPSQFATHGHLPDDLDATLSRKRGRRISSTSIVTLRSLHSEEGASARDTSPTTRKRTTSTTSATRQMSGRNQRARTVSISSAHNHSTPSLNDSYGHEPPKVVPSTLSDNSQLGLERVLRGRLVETFLAIHVQPSSEDAESEHDHSLSSPISQPNTPSSQTKSPPRKTGFSPEDSKFPSSPSSSDGPALHTSPGSSRTSKPHHKPSLPPLKNPDPDISPDPQDLTIPDYLSSVHRPSTNPAFLIDPRSEFAPGTDISGHVFKVEVWAKIGGGVADERKKPVVVNGKGKGKEKEVSQGQDGEWQVLERWSVDLLELIPLSDDPNATLQLPSNTLMISLDSTGQRFYVPPPKKILTATRSRSPSPTGYASDPETDVRRVKDLNESSPLVLPSRQRRRGTRHHTEDNVAKTASWQDLFALASLQTCIVEEEASLASIVEGVDALITDHDISVLRREVSERESRITELKANYITVSQSAQKIRDDMRVRREQLKHRREMLILARKQEEEMMQERGEIEEDVIDERARYDSLRTMFRPTRATLISTLASIFPIELLSPPDLLYTILDVPLPIPLSATDPAPPLFLPNHKDINEETVATALGYAALLLHLLATYLGKGLVYPITYIGSRSLIRDGISAMVGPRMFPLFSKGVDAYRYEYGVFLLNKDIELIMAEYDLRAMDIRHTLPNLKNLLLTLTDGASVPVGLPPSSRLSPVTSLTELESEASDVEESADTNSHITPSTTPKANNNLELPPSPNDMNGHSPTPANGSGAATPTAPSSSTDASLDTVKKPATSRFLGLSSLLRVRYPSSLLSSTTKGADGTGEGSETNNSAEVQESEPTSTPGSACGGGDLDEEDRRTIRGLETQEEGADQARIQESKSTIGNGHLETRPGSVEKHVPEQRPSSPPMVAHVGD